MGVVRTAMENIPAVRAAEAFVGGPKRLGLIFGVGAAAVGLIVSPIEVESHTDVQAGHGEVTKVYAMHEMCDVGYDAKMSGVVAKYGVDVKVFGASIPTTYSEQAEYDGTIGNKVCKSPENVHYYLPSDAEYKKRKECAGEKVCAVLKGKTTITTFETHPGEGYSVDGNGIARALTKNFVNMVNVLPVHLKADSLSNTLRGLAFLEAQQTSSTKCLQAALPVVQNVQNHAVAKDITDQINGASGFYNSAARLNPDGSDVAVVDESNVHDVTTQYTKLISQIKAQDDHLTMQTGAVGTCSMSPALKKQAEQLKVQGQEQS